MERRTEINTAMLSLFRSSANQAVELFGGHALAVRVRMETEAAEVEMTYSSSIQSLRHWL